MKGMAGMAMRYLLIDKQSIGDIWSNVLISLPALTSCVDTEFVLDTRRIPDGAGLDELVERVKETLVPDRNEAVQDNRNWASIEWTWQEYANRGQ
ncbi:uncharacterized protein BO87DRAFT_171433 [Aspergillus neoniger CBS 115656]|uniref:Uncharacterized protein n=1 Tax=Aspergillus neoniger (strain CBS 115656) TaxID=1448310 RepID=A0A318YYB0_ASPNB|nr:hypothetical protein BO87DRAFT_171433 [Aspergillus neoniger CBS 115656]PYH29922.1 hypothetical protein BO87DRAFT_171433 [Aspergillus neoniger CBS 115656]